MQLLVGVKVKSRKCVTHRADAFVWAHTEAICILLIVMLFILLFDSCKCGGKGNLLFVDVQLYFLGSCFIHVSLQVHFTYSFTITEDHICVA